MNEPLMQDFAGKVADDGAVVLVARPMWRIEEDDPPGAANGTPAPTTAAATTAD